jgi:hypothetical protein
MTNLSPFPLTCIRLRFRCHAEDRLHLGGFRAGSNLRGALVNVMRRATCAGDPSDAAHAATCPVCWLVAANDHPGQERRGYTITPPLGLGDSLQPGEGFDFHITLFGQAVSYLPYFVLAVPETGRNGVGPGRGRFELDSIQAEHPLYGDWPVLKPGENIVRPPDWVIDHAMIAQAVELSHMGRGRLRIDFLTPLRLIEDDRLLKSPDFGVIFARLLERLDDLSIQHAEGDRRPPEDRQRLWDLANRVRLVKSETAWVDVPSGSSRTGQQTWISGLVGLAWYSASPETWRELLPWLLWGELTQVGKDTTKGNGVFKLMPGE